MKIQEAVRQSTLRVAAGVLMMSCIMVAVFIFMGKFDATVLFGAVWGTVFAVLNFFLMGLSVQAAADLAAANPIPETSDEETTEEDHEQKQETAAGQQPLT